MSLSIVLGSLCNSILGANRNIQSVAVLNSKGRDFDGRYGAQLPHVREDRPHPILNYFKN